MDISTQTSYSITNQQDKIPHQEVFFKLSNVLSKTYTDPRIPHFYTTTHTMPPTFQFNFLDVIIGANNKYKISGIFSVILFLLLSTHVYNVISNNKFKRGNSIINQTHIENVTQGNGLAIMTKDGKTLEKITLIIINNSDTTDLFPSDRKWDQRQGSIELKVS